jgi:hypothetical protein
MGIRSLLEHLMITQVGDSGTFKGKLAKLRDQGLISLVQYDALNTLIHAGHAATHRFFNPTSKN